MSPFELSINDSKGLILCDIFLGKTLENSLGKLIIRNISDDAPCSFHSCFRVLISFTLDEEEKNEQARPGALRSNDG